MPSQGFPEALCQARAQRFAQTRLFAQGILQWCGLAHLFGLQTSRAFLSIPSRMLSQPRLSRSGPQENILQGLPVRFGLFWPYTPKDERTYPLLRTPASYSQKSGTPENPFLSRSTAPKTHGSGFLSRA